MKSSLNHKVKNIVLGTVQFGLDYGINNTSGKPSSSIVNRILDCAWENGIRYLDSAESYGNSHERIGNYHFESSKKFEVTTKFSPNRLNLGSITKNIESNLSVLGVEHLHTYMFHSFNDFMKFHNLFLPEFNRLKDRGVIRKIGVSLYTNDEISRVLEYDEIDIIQAPFNLLDNSNKRKKMFTLAKESEKEVHVRSIFLQGIFFKRFNEIPKKLKPLVKYLKKIEEEINNVDINQLCLNYALSKNYIDKVIVGVDSSTHLNKNIQQVSEELDKSLFDQIDEINVIEKDLLYPFNWQ